MAHVIQALGLNDKLSPARWAALALFFIYITTVLTSAFPVALLDLDWQQTMIEVLINNAPNPLIGLIILHVIKLIFPKSESTRKLLRQCSRLTKVVAVLFALIIPLEAFISIQQYNNLNQEVVSKTNAANAKFSTVQRSFSFINDQATAQNALSTLPPAQLQAFASMNFEQVRDKLIEISNSTRLREIQEIDTRMQTGQWRIIAMAIRNSLNAAAFAVAFAVATTKATKSGNTLEGLHHKKPETTTITNV